MDLELGLPVFDKENEFVGFTLQMFDDSTYVVYLSDTHDLTKFVSFNELLEDLRYLLSGIFKISYEKMKEKIATTYNYVASELTEELYYHLVLDFYLKKTKFKQHVNFKALPFKVLVPKDILKKEGLKWIMTYAKNDFEEFNLPINKIGRIYDHRVEGFLGRALAPFLIDTDFRYGEHIDVIFQRTRFIFRSTLVDMPAIANFNVNINHGERIAIKGAKITKRGKSYLEITKIFSFDQYKMWIYSSGA